MKKVLLSFVSIIIVCSCRKTKESLIKVIPQTYNTSCWAASLEMVLKLNNDTLNTECDIINKEMLDDIPYALNCNESKNCQEPEPITGNNYFKLIKGYNLNYNGTQEKLNFSQIYTTLNLAKKPIIYNFTINLNDTFLPDFGSLGSSHISLMTATENQTFKNHTLSLIKVSDPWPTCIGNEYYITYERYFFQKKPLQYVIYPSIKTDKEEDFKNYETIITKSNIYLNSIFKYSTGKEVANNFLENLKAKNDNLSSEFVRITNLDLNNLTKLKLGHEFKIYNVGDEHINVCVDEQICLNTILNINNSESLFCLMNKDQVQTILTTSNIGTNRKEEWILYHIENGKIFNDFFQIVFNQNIESLQNNFQPVILRFTKYDGYCLIYKNGTDIMTFDLYNNFYNQISPLLNRNSKFKDLIYFYNLNKKENGKHKSIR